MRVPLHIAVAFIVTAALAGWAAGGLHTERRIAFEWTASHVNHELKMDMLHD